MDGNPIRSNRGFGLDRFERDSGDPAFDSMKRLQMLTINIQKFEGRRCGNNLVSWISNKKRRER